MLHYIKYTTEAVKVKCQPKDSLSPVGGHAALIFRQGGGIGLIDGRGVLYAPPVAARVVFDVAGQVAAVLGNPLFLFPDQLLPKGAAP